MISAPHVFRDSHVIVAALPVGPFRMNQYLVACAATRRAVLVDAGAGPEPFVELANQLGLAIEAVWQTHGHVDHVAGLARTRAQLGLDIWLHPLDRPLYDAAPLVGKMYGFAVEPPPQPDHDLEDLQILELGLLRFEVRHTPGHCPGHVVFVEQTHNVCIAGDFIFSGSIGRTDLPGSDPEEMTRSLRRALQWPDDLELYPGHMSPTTIGRERRSNPWLKELGA